MNLDLAKIFQSLRDTPLFVLGGLAAASWMALLTPSWLGVDPGWAISEWRSYAYVSAAIFTMLSIARIIERLASAMQQAWAAAKAARRLSFNSAPAVALVNRTRQSDGTFTTQILIDIEVLNHSPDPVGLAGATLVRPCVPPRQVSHMDVSVLRLMSGSATRQLSIGPHTRVVVRLHCIVRGIYALPGSRARFVVHDTAGHHHRFPWMPLRGNPNEQPASWRERLFLWLRILFGMA
jgi:hypothetical protein